MLESVHNTERFNRGLAVLNYDLNERLEKGLRIFNQELEILAKLNLLSQAVHAEDFLMRMLNELYGWNLGNANLEHHNSDAVDLVGSDANGMPLSVQVTVSCTRDKVKRTLAKKKMADYAKEGYRVKFVFVGRQNPDAIGKQPFENIHGVRFDQENDLLYSIDLVEHFMHLDPKGQRAVLQIMDDAMGESTRHSIPESKANCTVEQINDRLKKRRLQHPSFGLMGDLHKGSIDNRLLPKGCSAGWIPNSARSVVQEGGSPVPFGDFIQASWEERDQCHLLITGEGGVGKTVALLTIATEEGFLPKGVAAVYIPLHELAQHCGKDKGTDSDCVDRFVRSDFPNGDEILAALKGLARKKWSGGPSMVLLMDGYNEVPVSLRTCVDAGVSKWASWPGVQVVTTSREVSLCGVPHMRSLVLQPLTDDDVWEFLGEAANAVQGNAWRLIHTPLMLRLYVETYRFKGEGADYVRWEKTDSAGHLVWNFLQRELWNCVEHENSYKPVEYAMAFQLTLPYISWKMETESQFLIDEEGFRKLVGEACSVWMGEKLPKRFESIENDEFGYVEDLAAQGMRRTADRQRTILTRATALVAERTDEGNKKSYSLLHQGFRDCFAALHVRNAMESATGIIPNELRQHLSPFVKGYLADLSTDSLLNTVWDLNRREHEASQVVTANILDTIHRKRGGDLSALNFAGMDLSAFNLYGYVSGGGTKLPDAQGFAQTRISLDTLTPQGHEGTVSSICFSRDGDLLASCSWDGDVLLWDVHARTVISAIRGNGTMMRAACFSPKGNLLAFGGDSGTLFLWNVETGFQNQDDTKKFRAVIDSDGGGINAICFSKEGQYLAFGTSRGIIYLYDVEGCELLGRSTSRYPSYADSVNSVCFCDNELIAYATQEGSYGAPYLLEHPMGYCLLFEYAAATSVCFSAKRGLLAAGFRNGLVKLWQVDGNQNKPVFSYRHGYHAECVSLSADGRVLASGSMDGTVRFWSVEARRELKTIKVGMGWVRSLDFSPDGRLLAAGSDDGSICVIDVEVGALVAEFGRKHFRVVWASCACDGALLALGYDDGAVHLWDAQQNKQIAVLWEEKGDHLASGCLSLDGRFLAASTTNGDLVLRDLKHRKRTVLHEGSGTYGSAVCFSRDERTLAFGFNTNASRGTIMMFDVRSHECISRLDEYDSSINSMAFSADGRLFVSSGNGVHVFRPMPGESLRDLGSQERLPVLATNGKPDPVEAVCFSSQRDVFATASVLNGVLLWNLDICEQIGPLVEHERLVSAICFSPDGSILVYGKHDGDICAWDVRNGRRLDRVRVAHGYVSAVLFCDDGKMLVACSWDGRVYTWRIGQNTDCWLGESSNIDIVAGIDVVGLNLSLASIDNDEDKEVLRQNGVKVSL